MVADQVLRRTYSVCPVCLKRIPARHVQSGTAVFLQKCCPEHGAFSSLIWRGKVSREQWIGDLPEIRDGENANCPDNCGLCPEHQQQTCCVLLEVTSRCNLNCRYCFADSREKADPSLAQIGEWLDQLAVPGKTLVQLSGGEPTVRDDLPQIVARAKAAGCRYVQLNSNGVRLANDPDYVRKLAEAGLSFVFLQFDGTDDQINRQLRGADLLELKRQAIANCAAWHIGVTLVPMLVPGVNTGNIGDILRFGISQSPAVRGVHFQPVSYFGRMPEQPKDEQRYTLDQLIGDIERQTAGQIKTANLRPSRCDHPLCGFHGDFVVLSEGIKALSQGKSAQGGCCSLPATADQNRAFVARRWERPMPDRQPAAGCCGERDIHDMAYFLQRVKSHGFTVTAMAFQDAGNLDLERLRRCSLHVFHQGKFVPFCAHYLSAWES